MRGSLIDLTGKSFGSLIVIGRAKRPEGCKRKEALWVCSCSCGCGKGDVVMRGTSLRKRDNLTCRRRKANGKQVKAEKHCTLCGSLMLVKFSDEQRGFGKYCSKKCQAEYLKTSNRSDQSRKNNVLWQKEDREKYPKKYKARSIFQVELRNGRTSPSL